LRREFGDKEMIFNALADGQNDEKDLTD